MEVAWFFLFAIVLAAFMRVAIHFGYRWIDKMLLVQPPIDPSKPIVLSLDRNEIRRMRTE